MNLEPFLRKTGIHFEKPETDINGKAVPLSNGSLTRGSITAKAIVVRGEHGYALCILPACFKVNLSWVAEVLQELDVEIAAPGEAEQIFDTPGYSTCPAGTHGSRIRTIMDERIATVDNLVMHNGHPNACVHVQSIECLRRLRPIVAEIGC